MLHRRTTVTTVAVSLLALGSTAAGAAPPGGEAGSGRFQFAPVPTSTACTDGGNPEQPFVLPPGYVQEVFAQEGDGGTIDLWDMNTQNETALSRIPQPFAADSLTGGPHVGRFLYRTHETSSNGQVSVTDLGQSEPDIETGREVTRVLAQRPDWERFDGIVWTPWGTILAAEETSRAAFPDPTVPQAQAGLVYEIDPVTGAAVTRPAIGSRSHEGLRFDAEGNLYGISETGRSRMVNGQEVLGGFIYRFTPDRKGDLSSGTLFALKVTAPTGDRTGEAVWVPLDPASAQVNSDAAAAAVQATGYDRPEDVETAESTGNNHGSGVNAVYVAITGEDRVLKIDLREPRSGREHLTAFVSDYVRDPENAPADFDDPDNLALDHAGNLYITEDPGGTTARGKQVGDDIWVAEPPQGQASPGAAGQQRPAERTVRFASLTDCDAEPTGIYFDVDGDVLYVNVQHRGGDGRDLAVRIQPEDAVAGQGGPATP
ncbi:MAG: hypothetical protein AVDCRST_MAG52-3306 [uncultured Blastococcus sp.]|uniref:Phosphatase n=1 Tax=uncultured Blastococcus sp. TaxID=217144 RepID=A0A6J4J909_9ACTN|nr:MAG: hypothetical protein AVDCRST_MAG52-3306 [uncultured Blastococcus sp.]